MPLPMLSVLAPEIVMAVMAMVLLLFGAYLKTHRAVLCIKVLTGLTLVLVALMIQADSGDNLRAQFMGMVQNDAFTRFATTLITLAALGTLLLSARWICALHNGGAEYSVLLLLATLGLMLMVASSNFLAFYVALELASLTMYVMASYERDHLKSTEAGIKYFVLGSLASGIMLFGISLIYGFAGSISFEAITGVMHTGGESAAHFGVIVGLVLVLAALCFKMSAVPFHMWTPDVYEGAPTPVVAFFATVPKIAAVCFLMRLTMEVFGSSAFYWQQVLMVMAMGSMLVGALAGLVQRNLKRLIAYSSIGHIGVVLLGILAGNVEAVQAVLVYMVIYLTMSFGLFAVLLLLHKDDKTIETLDDVAGLSNSHPKTAAALAILMFSMAGIPPFAGFFAKLFVFAAALEAGFVGLVVLGALCSVVSCFYYIRLVKVMYFDEQTEAPAITQKHPIAGYMLLASIAVNLFIFAPEAVMLPAKTAAMALFP